MGNEVIDLKIISLYVRVEVMDVGEVPSIFLQRENTENEEKKAERGNLGNITSH